MTRPTQILTAPSLELPSPRVPAAWTTHPQHCHGVHHQARANLSCTMLRAAPGLPLAVAALDAQRGLRALAHIDARLQLLGAAWCMQGGACMRV